MSGCKNIEKNRRGKLALEMLQRAGYEAYFVGGYVRDGMLRGFDYDADDVDIDITTNAMPEDVKRVFASMNVIETGIKHGTVTVVLREDESAVLPVEITTYRTESGYSDGRHPDSVAFTRSLEEDMKRRDFTVNAMAMDIDGNIIDCFGGKEDLQKHLIRAVGDPDKRFREDGLRIMRALRFSSVLGFDIETETERALFRNRDMLKALSVERVFSEFKKLVAGKYAPNVVRKYIDILGVVVPEMSAMKGFEQHNEYHKYDVLEHCIRAMEDIRTTPKNHGYMKLAALFHDIGKPLTYSQEDNGRGHFFGHAAKSKELTDVILKRFKADRALLERVGTLVKYHDLIFKKDEKLLKKWMNRFTPEVLFEILEIKRADNFATGNMSDELWDKFREIQIMMHEILENSECFSLKDLAVGGRDIMEIGIRPGPEIGSMLEMLLDAVIEGDAPNEKEALIEIARRSVNKM